MVSKHFFSIMLVCYAFLTCNAQTSFLVPYRLKAAWGYSDYSGKIIITPQYDSVGLFNYMNRKPYAEVYKKQKKGIISETGILVLPIAYDSINYIANIAAFVVSQNKKYGVVSDKNAVIIPVQYDELQFRSDHAYPTSNYDFFAKKKNQYFKITPKGVVSKIYEFDYYGENDIAFAEDFASPQKIDTEAISKKNNTIIDSISSRPIGEGDMAFYKIYKNNKIGFVRAKNIKDSILKEYVAPVYDSIIDIKYRYRKEGALFLVKRDSLKTIINILGELKMPLKYTAIGNWTDRFAYLKANKKTGFFHYNEQIEIEPRYDFIEYYPSAYHLWYVRKGNKRGFINKDGFEYFND